MLLSESLKEAITVFQKQRGWTRYKVAKEAGISQVLLDRFMSGKRGITLVTADKLAKVIGVKFQCQS